ncbi:outer membrane protein transport protein [Phaeovibrio sulfidiphilus]|uniref:Outer membrane protein transport protein n=1 Tax=Phaeovibrio sulfidiphilus TaxID=1220600 RepID=A0A8J7CCC7_9PROT|nr:outer membrane protein transport protein [Phaeovibrio sulfidiphilus]MBE1237128.1 outer membrane protein transport protein [Phaeovibrio sulfidiphilus]
MGKRTKKLALVAGGVAVASLFGAVPDARAEGFALYEYGARGLALGGGMMARKPDASAIAYNPSQITRLPGTQIMTGAAVVNPGGKMRTIDSKGNRQNTSLKDSYWLMPHGYISQQINEDWYFGFGMFSRFGLGFEYPQDWPGRYNITSVVLQSASVNPNIAWKATDKLSLAAGVEALWVNLDIRRRVPVSAFGGKYRTDLDSKITDANDIGWGFNVAGHYQFNDEWAFGAQYRSQVRVNAFGTIRMSDKGAGKLPDHHGSAHSSVKLPDSVAFGLAWTPRSDLSFETGAVWTRWSKFNALDISIPGSPYVPGGLAPSRKDWKDVWRFNVSAEYDVCDWMSLRASYIYDQSPMPNSTQDYLIPSDGRNIWGIGAGFRYENWTADLSYSYVDPFSRSYRADPSTGVMNSKTLDGYTHIVGLSLSYRF